MVGHLPSFSSSWFPMWAAFFKSLQCHLLPVACLVYTLLSPRVSGPPWPTQPFLCLPRREGLWNRSLIGKNKMEPETRGSVPHTPSHHDLGPLENSLPGPLTRRVLQVLAQSPALSPCLGLMFCCHHAENLKHVWISVQFCTGPHEWYSQSYSLSSCKTHLLQEDITPAPPRWSPITSIYSPTDTQWLPATIPPALS